MSAKATTAADGGRHRAESHPEVSAGLGVVGPILHAVVVLIGIGIVVAVGHWLRLPEGVLVSARVGHLVALAAGFGGVLVVDWWGLCWLRGRAELDDVLTVARVAHPVIWGGFVGLAVTGMLLRPGWSLLVAVKIVAVLAVGWNGIYLGARSAGGRPTTALLVRCAVVSQLGWWTAIVIGVSNATR